MIEFRLRESEFTPGAWCIDFRGEISRNAKLSKSNPEARWQPISSWGSKEAADKAVTEYVRLVR